ncbi:AEC family transporter [Brucella thiophenivorans]|uniref:Membrane transport family protein n=1 Tax=Brucella thiophenivorans TaxID=571255 RepID=A0A256G2K7_9HYPH|nr:AEC family transporter [Brucella thiophenivorans]OYR20901.1 membrane transport family protein [Brucella thiophenivorans]
MSGLLQSLTIVAPIVLVLILGFVAEKKKAFGDGPAPLTAINELVLTFALPAMLFFGTVTVSREAIINQLPQFVGLTATVLIMFFIAFSLAMFVFKRNAVESSIAGLGASFAAGPFYGPALLGGLYGDRADIAVSVFSLVVNIFLVPVAIVIIKMAMAKQAGNHSSVGKLVASSVFDSIFKTPFVLAPLIAFVLVFIDIKMPEFFLSSLELIGKATAGTAVFVAGMTIAVNQFKVNAEVITFAVMKNILLPVLFFVLMYVGFRDTTSTAFKENLLLCALPSAPLIVLLATRYKAYQEEASSLLAITTFGMMITLTIIMAIVV